MSPVPTRIIFGNIGWNIKLLTVQLAHARQVKTRARSGYYRLATLIGASIVEALVYLALRKRIGPTGVLSVEAQHKESAELPSPFVPTGEDWILCKRQKVEICLSPKTDLIHLNKACSVLSIYGVRLHKQIDSIRELRNRIHFHGLEQIDRRYTLNDIKRISLVINSLSSLL